MAQCGHCGRLVSREQARELRAWPDLGLDIGECPTPGCKQTLGFEPDDLPTDPDASSAAALIRDDVPLMAVAK